MCEGKGGREKGAASAHGVEVVVKGFMDRRAYGDGLVGGGGEDESLSDRMCESERIKRMRSMQ